MEIAVYGKGGIGKSTISANLSAALASRRRHVLQIGCDPKHDSTRLLHHGQRVRTVLDYILNTPPEDQKISDVLMEGFGGTGCIEAGGPKPGMGCAGRGILTSFEFLERFHIKARYDDVIYDVLGDVVCGGFAVPVRSQYADAIFLVTSGEFMALYAANNILRGIQNLSGDGERRRRVAGILFNSRAVSGERARVATFARAVSLPILADIPRSDAFAAAEREARTVVEGMPDSPEARVFLNLADAILSGLPLHEAKPLSEEEMERLMQGEAVRPAKAQEDSGQTAAETVPEAAAAPVLPQKRALSDPLSRVPLFGCAFNGVMALAAHVRDAGILNHAPRSCVVFAYNGISAYARRGMLERGILYPVFSPEYFTATDMNIRDVIHGGIDSVRAQAERLYRRGCRDILLITACIPGLIGDDYAELSRDLSARGCRLYVMAADGIEVGDYNAGVQLCYRVLAEQMIDPAIEPEDGCVNLVYERMIAPNREENYRAVKALLDGLGLEINCRFLCETTVGAVKRFKRAKWNLMARTDAYGEALKRLLEERHGAKFMEGTLPVGYAQTCAWLRRLGELFCRGDRAEALIDAWTEKYRAGIDELCSKTQGVRCAVFLTDPSCLWVMDFIRDLGMEVVYAQLPATSGEVNGAWNHRFSSAWNADREALAKEVRALRPDIVLSNAMLDESALAAPVGKVKAIADVGFMAGMEDARDWLREMDALKGGGWKDDRALFEEYYA